MATIPVFYPPQNPAQPSGLKFGLNVGKPPDGGGLPSPWLTVNGQVGIGFDISTTQPYSDNAPNLSVIGKTRLWNPRSTSAQIADAAAAASSHAPNAPTLLVDEKVGIGFSLNANHTYLNAPALNVAGKARISSQETARGNHSTSAPSLLVDEKVGIGFSLNANQSYSSNAPALNVAGKTRISTPGTATGGHSTSAPSLLVDNNAGIGFSLGGNDVVALPPGAAAPALFVSGNTVLGRSGFEPRRPYADDRYDPSYPKNFIRRAPSTPADVRVAGTLEVTQDAVFGGRIFFTQNSSGSDVTDIQDGAAGAPGTDASLPSFLYAEPDAQPQRRYPVFCAVNGLMGQVETTMTGDMESIIEAIVRERRPTLRADEHYILMGQLDELLRFARPQVREADRDAYGIRMKWDTGYAMLTLQDVDSRDHDRRDRGRRRRKDTVLAFGGAKEALLRVRYMGTREQVTGGARVRLAKEAAIRRGAVAKDAEGSGPGRVLVRAPGGNVPRRDRVPIDSLQYVSDRGFASYRDVLVVHRDGVTINGPLYSRKATPSDAGLKEDVRPIRGALDKVMAMRGVTYAWKDDGPGGQAGKREYGMIAQEVKKACPEAVSKSPQKFLAIDFDQITPLLLEALKEQQDLILAQRARLDELEERLAGDGASDKKKKRPRKRAKRAA